MSEATKKGDSLTPAECEHTTLVARADGTWECISCDQRFDLVEVQ